MRIRNIIIAMAAIAILASGISAGLIYVTLQKASQKEALLIATNHTHTVHVRVNQMLSDNLKAVSAIAGLHDVIQAAAAPSGATRGKANQVLSGLQKTLEVDVCYLMNAEGLTLASSNHDSPLSFVGKNYAFRPYFQNAIQGRASVYMAVGVTSGKRGIYYSHPVYAGGGGQPIGAAVLKAETNAIQRELGYSFHPHDDILMLTDPNGVIFLSDPPAFQDHLLWQKPEATIAEIGKSRQFGSGPQNWIGFRRVAGNRVENKAGRSYIIHTAGIEQSPGWQIVHLIDLASSVKIHTDPISRVLVPLVLGVCGLVAVAVMTLVRHARTDLHARVLLEQKLARQSGYLSTLHTVSLGLLNRLDSDDLLEAVLQGACNLFDTAHAYLYMLDTNGDTMRMRMAQGGRFDQLKDFEIQPGQGISGKVWTTGQAQCIDHYPAWPNRIPHPALDDVITIMAVPVHAKGRIAGVLGVGLTEERSEANEEMVDILERYSELIAISLDNAQLYGTAQTALQERLRVQTELNESLRTSQKQTEEIRSLLTALQAMVDSPSFAEASQAIFTQSKTAIGASMGFMAMYSEETNENEMLFVDAGEGPFTGDLPIRIPVGGLQAEAYQRHQAVYDNDFVQSGQQPYLPAGHLPLENALFAPMVSDGKNIGMMALANKPGGFSESDVKLARAFSDQSATALKQSLTLEALEKSETRFRSVIEKNADAIMVVDQEGVIRFANSAADVFFRRSRGSLLGSPFGFPVTTGEGTEIEVPNPDGTSAIAEMRLVETEWEGETVYFASLRDVSERIAAEREREFLEMKLQRSQKMEAIGTLAGGIAHDFNNILSAVIGFTEVSQDLVEKDSQLYLNLKEVLGAGYRAKELVRQILTFSRQSEHEPVPIQVSHLIKEVIPLLRASLPTTIRIEQFMDSASLVMADTTQIHQVLMNLCTNAGFAMTASGGTLTISVCDVGEGEALPFIPFPSAARRYQRISVGDTGRGIEPRHLDRIFDPFFTTKEKGEGTGMGLSVVHGIVEGHKGHITVDNKPGQGVTFHVYLPIVENEKQAHPLEKGERLPCGDESILIVDDERAIAKMGKQSLERLGYNVVETADSLQALAMIESDPGRFDLLITDLTMPSMTGMQLAEKVLLIRPDLPIILSTGFSGELTAEELKSNGIRGLLRKPPLKQEMAVMVRNALDGLTASCEPV